MKREKQVVVRLRDDEKELIQKAAEKIGTTVAGIMRQAGVEKARSVIEV